MDHNSDARRGDDNDSNNSKAIVAHPAAATSMAAHDMRGVPNLPSLQVLLRAIAVVHTAAVAHADAEQRFVARARRHRAVRAASLTPFHSESLPAMPLTAYALSVATHTKYGAEGLATGLALFARYAVASGRGVTPLTMHRLLGTCMQTGMKASSDRFLKNVYAAPKAGMTLPELNELEGALADALGFRMIPTAAEVCELPRRLAELRSPSLDRVHEILVACCHPDVAADSSLPLPPEEPMPLLTLVDDNDTRSLFATRPSFVLDRAADASVTVRSPCAPDASLSEWAPGRSRCGLSAAQEASAMGHD